MAQELLHVTGKRKTSIARVWMKPGAGQITINKRPMDQYLQRESDRALVKTPFEVTDTVDKFDVYVNVRGGGISGQATAIRHGISDHYDSMTGATLGVRHLGMTCTILTMMLDDLCNKHTLTIRRE